MTDLEKRLRLKARLPRAWGAFLERYGTFTATQLAAMPAVLDGHNVMVCAATASGKTEAVVAPLVELYCGPNRRHVGPILLFLTPTRALATDLQARLVHPLQTAGVSLGVRTGDVHTFRPARPPDFLLTTPESLDSLLATQAKLFIHLRAIVIDELHVLHGSARGDQLRVLVRRLQRIRQYAFEHEMVDDDAIQYCALSATLDNPEQVAESYFAAPHVIQVAGRRTLDADHIDLPPGAGTTLGPFIELLRGRGWRKILGFCNTRAEVEAYAAALRSHSPFGTNVYVHYSNIAPKRRHEIEQSFSRADSAICVASSTLELGIDVGDIDLVLLIGPPGNLASFLQRIGRGNRRQMVTRLACVSRTPLERLVFDALLDAAQAMPDDGHSAGEGWAHASFRPSVAVQQIFSLIK